WGRQVIVAGRRGQRPRTHGGTSPPRPGRRTGPGTAGTGTSGVAALGPLDAPGQRTLLDVNAGPQAAPLEARPEAGTGEHPLHEAGADRPRASGERVDDRLGQRRQVDAEDADQPREHDADRRSDEGTDHAPPRVRLLCGGRSMGVHGYSSFPRWGACSLMYSSSCSVVYGGGG